MEFDMGEDAVRTEFDEYPVSTETESEKDLLPEHSQYRDEGCELAGSCLNCPFPECVYDRPGGKKRWQKEGRSTEMARLFNMEGKRIKELAEIFGVSRRTVQRDLKAAVCRNNRREKNV
jgi:hypothetical protein